MASRIPARRRRKQRFSEAELTVLVEHIVDHAEMLFSADQQRATQQSCKEVWAEAARTVKDCHKRWDDLRLRVRNLIAAYRHHSTGTGGSPAYPLKLQSWEERCSSVLHLEGIHGIGDAEAGVSPPVDAGMSSGSDNAQQVTQHTPARGQCSPPAWDDEAGISGTQAPASAAPGTDAPADVSVPMQAATPTMATDSIQQAVCTVEEAYPVATVPQPCSPKSENRRRGQHG
ncbi:myb-related transcription factor, partner of profilin-like [Ambystoma mexicanum]|uniref:myb-related transcription factor, partner of profilin-like n=1 Tax=Ambystoma mexicanum TaxID=8296 RepID=UPI0037E83178